MNDTSNDYCHSCRKRTTWRMNSWGTWVCTECEHREADWMRRQQQEVGRREPDHPTHKHEKRGRGW